MEHSSFWQKNRVISTVPGVNQLRSRIVPCRAHRSQIEKRAVRAGSGSSLPGYTPQSTVHCSSARGRASRSASQHVYSLNVNTQQGSKARIYVSFYGGEGSTGHLSLRDSAQHSAVGAFTSHAAAPRTRPSMT